MTAPVTAIPMMRIAPTAGATPASPANAGDFGSALNSAI